MQSKSPSFDEVAAQFPVNSYVLVAYPIGSRPDNKLMAQWQGPMQVVAFSGTEYEVRNLVTMKTQLVHIKRLKPFVTSPNRSPESIAFAEAGVWEILMVHAHRQPRRGSRLGLEFLVEWAGYPNKADGKIGQRNWDVQHLSLNIATRIDHYDDLFRRGYDAREFFGYFSL